MANTDLTYDVIVIGGGPAGLMAALAAAEQGARTVLIEKGNRLGRKLGISGGGRCNVTNAKPLPELMENIPGNGRFLHSALHRFSNKDVMAFFEGLGIGLKEEDRGRVFPVTDKAQTVVKALVNRVFEAGVDVWEECRVNGLYVEDAAKTGDHERDEQTSEGTGIPQVRGVILADKRTIRASSVIIATGGASVPKTGSTGDAYPWAKRVGHSIVSPYPTEVPLTSDEWFIRDRTLQGLSLRSINISVFLQGNKLKRLTTESGDLLFTHFGLSGPAALRCSHYVSTARRKDDQCSLLAHIDVLPGQTKDELLSELKSAKESEPRKHVHNLLPRYIPDRLADVIIHRCNITPDHPMSDIKNTELEAVVQHIKAFPVAISGTLPLAQATVTGGGVSVREIDPKTMASKVCDGLFFAGEVMDVHAHTGGYNITVAFSSGHLAGTSAAAYALDGVDQVHSDC